MYTTYKQETEFLSNVISSRLLEDSIRWIKENLNPDDVFDEKQLSSWALDNDFTKEE